MTNSAGMIDNYLEACKGCERHETRTNVCRSHFSLGARFAFIFDSPSEDDDEQGYFAEDGDRLDLLEKIASYLGVDLNSSYISGRVRCYSLKPVTSKQIKDCSLWISNELRAIKPDVMFLFGEKAQKGYVREELSSPITTTLWPGKSVTLVPLPRTEERKSKNQLFKKQLTAAKKVVERCRK